jgi:hypothetical protein
MKNERQPLQYAYANTIYEDIINLGIFRDCNNNLVILFDKKKNFTNQQQSLPQRISSGAFIHSIGSLHYRIQEKTQFNVNSEALLNYKLNSRDTYEQSYPILLQAIADVAIGTKKINDFPSLEDIKEAYFKKNKDEELNDQRDAYAFGLKKPLFRTFIDDLLLCHENTEYTAIKKGQRVNIEYKILPEDKYFKYGPIHKVTIKTEIVRKEGSLSQKFIPNKTL